MTYETTLPGEDFFPFIKAATDFVGDAKVIFEDYVVISSLDPAGILLVDTAVRNPNPPPEPIEVILDLRSIVGLTSVKNDVKISIPGNKRVGIETGRMSYTLPEILEPHLKHRKMPNKEFPVKLVVKSDAFIDGVQGMVDANKAIEESIGMWFIVDDEETFYFHDAMKQHSKAVFTPGDEFSVGVFESPASALFPFDYLTDMIKHFKKFDTIKICLSKDEPMILIAMNDERKLAYAIANRMLPR